MKNEYYPWTFDINEQIGSNETKLFVLYGKDFSLANSMSRATNSAFYSEIMPHEVSSLLYTESLFDDLKEIRVFVSQKVCEQFIKYYLSKEFVRKVILIVESGSILTKTEKVCYVKCDELNKKTRKMFIDFWNKKLSSDISYESQINNLDDFHFMILKKQLGCDAGLLSPSEEYSAWNAIRTEQFRSKKLYQPIFKHLELWARNNVPNEETLQLCYEKVKSEIRRFRDEVSQGN